MRDYLPECETSYLTGTPECGFLESGFARQPSLGSPFGTAFSGNSLSDVGPELRGCAPGLLWSDRR